ncbi:Na+/H+ antiporter subunit E [Gulosibacter macacae]|uniref:Na+/H+ antiporter subunit E n=1 Tax=Gulosibacter macacae TaxID=2488791 RepID=A0A3P3VZZ1_9MICO|nr:Na+/H+ antiporter subunit E [Gulosibacter macacae]RRJ88345.1 Na+/H+ antiporter subunit E [Gulosibacter macacae]
MNVRSKSDRKLWLTQLPLLVALVLLWLVLWGHVDVISVVTGIAFSVFVVRVFYLPPVELSNRFHLGWALVFLARFLWWVLRASVNVAWLALRPQKPPVSSIIAVRMRTRSDWLLTLAAEVNILVPGSVVVDVDRSLGVLYLHVLDADTPEEVEEARDFSFVIEEALTLALGSRDDLARVNRSRVDQGLKPLPISARQRRHEEALEAERVQREHAWEENS